MGHSVTASCPAVLESIRNEIWEVLREVSRELFTEEHLEHWRWEEAERSLLTGLRPGNLWRPEAREDPEDSRLHSFPGAVC